MPFTDNRAFCKDPMAFADAESLHYIRDDGGGLALISIFREAVWERALAPSDALFLRPAAE